MDPPGSRTVGVQRQYTGTAGRIENAQVAVFLAYASHFGYTLIDRDVYLPRCWTDDPERCTAAVVWDDREPTRRVQDSPRTFLD